MTTQNMGALLQSLVIVLCGFRSFLSEELGSEVLNLLTDKQYELLLKNLLKTRELLVHGLPGTGKTILALRILETIRNVFHCQQSDILYACENQPLRNFVRYAAWLYTLFPWVILTVVHLSLNAKIHTVFTTSRGVKSRIDFLCLTGETWLCFFHFQQEQNLPGSDLKSLHEK